MKGYLMKKTFLIFILWLIVYRFDIQKENCKYPETETFGCDCAKPHSSIPTEKR